MSATILKIIKKAGDTYGVDDTGAVDIQTRYQVVYSEPVDISANVPTAFAISGGTSIPSIGTVHPDRRGYYVAKYDVRQPDASAKNTLDVTVRYSPQQFKTENVGTQEQPDNVNSNIEQWGWDDGTATRDLVTAADNDKTPVLNKADDVFESVPQVETPAPTFTKVVRFSARRTGWFGYNCKTNAAQVTIGGIQFPARTLLCTIAETLDPSNVLWPFKYSVRLRYRSNLAAINGGTWTECGWDAVVVNAGMREKDATTGELKLIQVVSAETGQLATVTSPELLDMNGQAVTRGGGSSTPPVYNLRFQAYETANFPDWFTSEPPLAIDPPPNNQQNANN